MEEKQKKCQKSSKPVVDAFFEWVNTTINTKIIVNNKLKKALVYAQNQQEELPQLEFLNAESLEKYLPWSEELPESIRNFQGEYK